MTGTESESVRGRSLGGSAAGRRRALTSAGVARPAAEQIVDMLDEMAAPLMTREEADARFDAMLTRFQAECAQDRARMEARFSQMEARMEARFGKIEARFGEIDGRFGEIDGRFGEINGRFGEIDGRFGEIKADLEKLRADMTWRILLIVGGLLAATTALNRLLG